MTGAESARLRSISALVVNRARDLGQDPNRVRRQLAFHRLADRLSGSGWVLKGGFCLEVRLPHAARATKDMDLVRREGVTGDDALLDELDALFQIPSVDGFSFDARSVARLRDPGGAPEAWRVGIDALVDGRLFASVKLDLVTQFDEVADAVEPLQLASPVPGLGLEPVIMPAVDVYQHAAEKFHAMSRLYAGDRPSTRVKDLVDLVLLAESGLLADPSRLGERLVVVHRLRDGAWPPEELIVVPADWNDRYARMVADLGVTARTCDDAYALIDPLYRSAVKGLRS